METTNELLTQLHHLKTKHQEVQQDIENAIKIAETNPEQKGKIALLLTNYRNNLDTVKQEIAETFLILK